MPRIVSTSTVAAISTVRMLIKLPIHIVRRIAASPEAFIDAIERLAKR